MVKTSPVRPIVFYNFELYLVKFKLLVNGIKRLPLFLVIWISTHHLLILVFISRNLKAMNLILHVDDGVICGTPKIIEKVMKSISSVLKVKGFGEVKNFVGWRLIHSIDGKTIHIFQPKLIKNLEDSFSQYINTNRKFQTPGAPKTVVMRPEKGDNVLSPKDQTKYHSGVGMLLYLVKHSRPDISNSVRELTKV
jgi:hypothetical protein